MQDELQLQHLSRYEKKQLIKGWHATQASSYEPSDANQVGRVSSLQALFAPPSGALAEEFTNDHDELQQDETLPKTVGQVKHAYRARARKEEARDVFNAVQRREMHLEQRRRPRWPERDPQTTGESRQLPTMEFHENNIKNEENGDNNRTAATDTLEDKMERELQLLDLPTDEIVTNATYREEILRQIRRQLANGGEVLLQSDCPIVDETVKNTRFMLQMLCTLSLAYCTRDQHVVPEIVLSLRSTKRLRLRLLPRHQTMCLTTSLYNNTEV